MLDKSMEQSSQHDIIKFRVYIEKMCDSGMNLSSSIAFVS